MRARAVLILASVLLLQACSSGPTVDSICEALEGAGIHVTYLAAYERRDTGWWTASATRYEMGLDLANCYNPGISLYEFSSEQEAVRAAQGELPGGPQGALLSWPAQPHCFQNGRLVVMVVIPPAAGNLDARETAAMEADVGQVLEVLEAQMGAEVPIEDWTR